MTSHPTVSFQHGVQPGAGEGGPGGGEARRDRKPPLLVSPQILAAHYRGTDHSPRTDGTRRRWDRARYVCFIHIHPLAPAGAAAAASFCFNFFPPARQQSSFSSPKSKPRLPLCCGGVYVILSTAPTAEDASSGWGFTISITSHPSLVVHRNLSAARSRLCKKEEKRFQR